MGETLNSDQSSAVQCSGRSQQYEAVAEVFCSETYFSFRTTREPTILFSNYESIWKLKFHILLHPQISRLASMNQHAFGSMNGVSSGRLLILMTMWRKLEEFLVEGTIKNPFPWVIKKMQLFEKFIEKQRDSIYSHRHKKICTPKDPTDPLQTRWIFCTPLAKQMISFSRRPPTGWSGG